MFHKLTVLLVEPAAAPPTIRSLLAELPADVVHTEAASDTPEAISRMRSGHVDVAVVDPRVERAAGTLATLRDQGVGVPVVLVCDAADEPDMRAAIESGHGTDYVVRGTVNADGLLRSLRYAVDRHRTAAKLRELAVVDELTGLSNRNGFNVIAEHRMKLATRMATPLTLFLIDVVGTRDINDWFGRSEGDRALVDAATVVRSTFRNSDVVARVGGDEFCALLPANGFQAQVVLDRFYEVLATWRQRQPRPYALRLSVGMASFDPENACSLEQLMETAERAIRRAKQPEGGPPAAE